MQQSVQSPSDHLFAIRLFGFTDREIAIFNATFSVEQSRKKSYFCLPENCVQAPDLYLADGEDLVALAALTSMNPTSVRPALLVGKPAIDLPYASVSKPVKWRQLFTILDELVEKRQMLLGSKDHAHIVDAAFGSGMTERRRTQRIDLDLTDPSIYEQMRAQNTPFNRILVVDRDPVLQQELSSSMAPFGVPVDGTDSATAAVEACTEQPMSLVLIRAGAASANPYRLCSDIKLLHSNLRTSVVLVLDPDVAYDEKLAFECGCDGYISSKLRANQLFLALAKFLSMPAGMLDQPMPHSDVLENARSLLSGKNGRTA